MANLFGGEFYAPCSNSETCLDAPLSTRFLLENWSNLINFHDFHENEIITHICVPLFVEDKNLEHIAFIFAPRQIPSDAHQGVFKVGARRTSGSGTLKGQIITSRMKYPGSYYVPSNLQTIYHAYYAGMDYEMCATDEHEIFTGKTALMQDEAGLTYVVLTAHRSDTSSTFEITSFFLEVNYQWQ